MADQFSKYPTNIILGQPFVLAKVKCYFYLWVNMLRSMFVISGSSLYPGFIIERVNCILTRTIVRTATFYGIFIVPTYVHVLCCSITYTPSLECLCINIGQLYLHFNMRIILSLFLQLLICWIDMQNTMLFNNVSFGQILWVTVLTVQGGYGPV